jgi:hypothetical protein
MKICASILVAGLWMRGKKREQGYEYRSLFKLIFVFLKQMAE